jgi:hypothetical protein
MICFVTHRRWVVSWYTGRWKSREVEGKIGREMEEKKIREMGEKYDTGPEEEEDYEMIQFLDLY